jgi:para-nitrobenzyl esterase
VLPTRADEIFAAGEQNHVPVIVGSMSDEGSTLYAGMAEPTKDEFVSGLRAQYGGDADAVLAAYTAEIDTSTKIAGQAIQADRSFTWQMRAWARAMNGSNDVYVYFFSHAPPVFRLYVPDRPDLDVPGGRRSNGAYHSGDLAYAFGNVGLVGIEWNDRDRELSDQMSQYWVNFAKTGNPNGDGLPEWPAYDRETEGAIEFGTDGTVGVAKVREQKLDLFDKGYGASN